MVTTMVEAWATSAGDCAAFAPGIAWAAFSTAAGFLSYTVKE